MILSLVSAWELSGGWLNTDSCNLPFPHRDANLVDLKGYEICISKKKKKKEICISNKLPGDADAAGLGMALWELLYWNKLL